MSPQMEIHLENIAISATPNQIKLAVAKIIHTSPYTRHSKLPLNLAVTIYPPKNGPVQRTRHGALTLPLAAVGEEFLSEFGGVKPKRTIVVGTRLRFTKSRNKPRIDILNNIRRLPFVDSTEEEQRKSLITHLHSSRILLDAVQFGWRCRDGTFSIEWELPCHSHGKVSYDDDRREFCIQVFGLEDTRLIVIHVASIGWASAHVDSNQDAVVALELQQPPSFETGPAVALEELFTRLHLDANAPTPRNRPVRHRWQALDPTHLEVAPYASLMLRLVCAEVEHLGQFRQLSRMAHVRLQDYAMPIARRGLFSDPVRQLYHKWLRHTEWPIAFQIESLTRRCLVDLKEALTLRNSIRWMVTERGVAQAAAFLQHFITQMKSVYYHINWEDESVLQFFDRCASERAAPSQQRRIGRYNTENETFQSLHAIVTPTTYHLDGPYPERLNRVMRWYPKHHDCFLRVNFVDEAHLQFRFDRDVDGREFIKRRFGDILTNGLDIAGRHFKFLAYSQSALKDHAVWFMKEFVDEETQELVTPSTIIKRIGNFTHLVYDPKLIYCPARYGARISQSFTATDSSITAEAEEVLMLDDIWDPTKTWAFTDGVGTISPELARAISNELRARGRRANRGRTYPRAFQIRFMGTKGMLSVDHTLAGRAICIRPSMIKFDAPNSREIEIAHAFDRPGPLYLNRPLIMILEALGVPYEAFHELQNAAVADAQRSVQSVGRSAELLEKHGLGASFKLSSVMLGLSKLGVDNLLWDEFFEQMMDFAVNHILRELKHHARIPVKEGWNLVGVADVHKYLEPREVFVHIAPVSGGSIYLEGLVTVSRSPTIHPGDVQVLRAIGRPPSDSPFAKESLQNCIVFSVQGERPIPSYLGGGDLDGDTYCVTAFEGLRPKRMYQPAPYKPAKKLLLTRPSTMQDVADFVTEYLSSDRLGHIGKTWLVIADQSEDGIFDDDCLLLSQLHSDAVDYPKSGNPVPLEDIPRYKFKAQPDWSAPEISGKPDPSRFYASQRAIGKLFRAIELPAVATVDRALRTQREQLARENMVTLEDIYEDFDTSDNYDDVGEAIREHVSAYIRLTRQDKTLISEMWGLAESYRADLQTICADHTLSRSRNAMLTEEEAMVGTIVAQCSQARRRKNEISKLREHTAGLVQDIEHQLAGELGTTAQTSLRRAWVAYRISLLTCHQFGARSFGWIAMREIFDRIKAIEEDKTDES
ncbi:hypothetical protein EIP91_005603 [Steccherinum ochraceum]|uniref:RNA-dependent RNA polymerase n=1 Tax=Steccherinum ochraceum TaxID=92696 RepID=A0A4R0RD33_9APHY|nr:hypothetical protein EIP91_005603 [Steccherinum ochraceum]